MYKHFDEMSWPVPGEKMEGLEWRLRHLQKIDRTDLVAAASVISAYSELVKCSSRKRACVIRKLKQK